MDDSEGAHRWMQVFDELGARGVEGILYAGSDGVAGLGEGLGSSRQRPTGAASSTWSATR